MRNARAATVALLALALALPGTAEARKHRRKAAAPSQAAHDDNVIAQKRVAAGETWVVRQSTQLKHLVLAEGGRIEAPQGRLVVLGVDGVGRALEPGTYAGDVALAVPIEVRLRDPALDGLELRTALCVGSGLYLPEKSAAGLFMGGKVANGAATGTTITSTDPKLMAVLAMGEGSYALQGVHLVVAGAGALVAGPARLSLDAATTVESGAGAVRIAGQSARVTLDGASVHSATGVLAEFIGGARGQLVLRGARYAGDVLHVPGAGGAPQVALEGAVLEGAMGPSMAGPRAVADAADPWANAPSVSLDATSRWVLTRSTRVGALTLAAGAVLEAHAGASLALFIDGRPVPVAPGRYAGRIDLQVSASATP